MMSDSARSIVLVFEECHTRIQTVSELLLISCIPRPVFTRPEDLAQTKESFVRYRDKVIGQLNRMLILSRDIATQVHGKQIHWKSFCQRTQELTTTVIHLSELTAHIAYLMAINTAESQPAVSGSVANIHQLTQADLDIRFSCTKLKRSRMNDLQPHVLVDLCGTLTKALTTMTDICRHAADKIADSNDQDQFKLCVKAINSTTGCLVSSIKSFKQSPSETHLQRLVTFCDPVTSTSSALLNFATEEGFLGQPAKLSTEGLEKFKSVLGLCMSMASANIQICRAVRDLVYSSSTKRHQDRMSLCVESITRSSSQLRDLLLSYEFIPKPQPDVTASTDSIKECKSQGDNKSKSNSQQEPAVREVQVDSNKDSSKLLPHEENHETVSSHNQRSSAVDDSINAQERKESILAGAGENLVSVEVVHGDNRVENLDEKETSSETLSIPLTSPSSRPASLISLTGETTTTLPAGMGESPVGTFSPQFLSSPLSISSTSLASTTSSNVEPALLELAERAESVLVLENLSSSQRDSPGREGGDAAEKECDSHDL